MDKQKALDAIQRSNLREFSDEFAQLLSPSIRIVAKRTLLRPRGVSRFWGVPMLPSDAVWPHWDGQPYFEVQMVRSEKQLRAAPPHIAEFKKASLDRQRKEAKRGSRPLAFLAQINLAEVLRCSSLPDLPGNGMLSFFYDAENCPNASDPLSRGCGQVRYDIGDMAPAAPPRALPAASQFRRCALALTEEWILPDMIIPAADSHLRKLLTVGTDKLEIWQNEQYRALHESLMRRQRMNLIHRLGGHPQQVQNDMRLECQLASTGIHCKTEHYRTPLSTSLQKATNDWQLLLQIDSDELPGWMWGDMGRLYFWIRRQDLKLRDFGNVWPVMQCH